MPIVDPTSQSWPRAVDASTWYFASKDDLVLGEYDLMGDHMLDALDSRPDDESLWTALQAMFEAVGASASPTPRFTPSKPSSRTRRRCGRGTSTAWT